jgi:chorismate mutase
VQAVAAESEAVASLREELARVDRAIVVLLSARLTLAARVIAARAGTGGSATLRPQERVVLRRVHDWAADLDVPAEMVGTLFTSLIEAGKERYRIQQAARPAPVVRTAEAGQSPSPAAREPVRRAVPS